MKKEKTVEFNKKLLELYNNYFKSFDKVTHSIIKFYCHSYKILEHDLYIHNISEPLKIMKKKHIEWENQKRKIEKEQRELLEKIKYEFKELNIKY